MLAPLGMTARVVDGIKACEIRWSALFRLSPPNRKTHYRTRPPRLMLSATLLPLYQINR